MKTLDKLSLNKQAVRDFYEAAFNLHQPRQAAQKHLGTTYIQHNPAAGDGAEPFIKFVEDYVASYPELHVEIKRIIAEGDLVVTHSRITTNKNDRGMASADIFRLENGKIVEHWDVIQPIPETSANNNGML